MIEQIRSNKRKVFIGGALYVALVIGITGFLFYKIFVEEKPNHSNSYLSLALILFILIDTLCILFVFLKGKTMVLWKSKATTIYPGGFDEVREAVHDISIASGISLPELAFIEDDHCNVFSLQTRKRGMIIFTHGLAKTLNRGELRAVVAHEMAHLFNHDSYLNTFIAYLRGFTHISMNPNKGEFSTMSKREVVGETALATLIPAWVIFFIFLLAKILSEMSTEYPLQRIVLGIPLLVLVNTAILIILGMLMQWVINPTRELLADALALKWTMHPEAIANALRKIENNCTLKSLAFLKGALFAPQKTSSSWAHELQPSVDARIRNLEKLLHADVDST
jgi:Zn-dependent protease with chaperone function